MGLISSIMVTLAECPICLRKLKMVLDHSHVTGVSRDPICRSCNAGLGMFKDDQAALARAITYLQKHEAQPSREQWVRAQYRSFHPRARA